MYEHDEAEKVIYYLLSSLRQTREGHCDTFWLEHLTHDHKAVGSSPDSSSLCWDRWRNKRVAWMDNVHRPRMRKGRDRDTEEKEKKLKERGILRMFVKYLLATLFK